MQQNGGLLHLMGVTTKRLDYEKDSDSFDIALCCSFLVGTADRSAGFAGTPFHEGVAVSSDEGREDVAGVS